MRTYVWSGAFGANLGDELEMLPGAREVLSGYSGDLYEYEDERSVREVLAPALIDDRLLQFEAWAGMVKDALSADERLREFLAGGPVVEPGKIWWRERLPPRAERGFVEDAERVYGVHLDVM